MPATTPITDEYIDSIIISQGPYDPNLNKTQGVQLRELIKTLRDNLQDQIVESSGGGSTHFSYNFYQTVL